MKKTLIKRLKTFGLSTSLVLISLLTASCQTARVEHLYLDTSCPDYLYLENGQTFTNNTGKKIKLVSERVLDEKDAIISDLRAVINQLVEKDKVN